MSQDLIVGLIVCVAVLYLARMVWMQTLGKSNCGCGKSGACASKAATKTASKIANTAATSSTRSDAKSDVRLPPHLVQITTRDKVNLN